MGTIYSVTQNFDMQFKFFICIYMYVMYHARSGAFLYHSLYDSDFWTYSEIQNFVETVIFVQFMKGELYTLLRPNRNFKQHGTKFSYKL